MLSDSELLTQFEDHRKITEAGLALQYAENTENQAFYAGDMMQYRGQVRSANANRRVMVQFNKVKPYVSAVKGFMAQNRRKPKYFARVQDNEMQEAYSAYLNGVSDYCRDNANADQVETQQDGDMLICGYGAINTDISYGLDGATRDPNGECVMERVSPNMVGWDPMARSTNLLDARWVDMRKQFYKTEAESLFGKKFTEQADEVNSDGEVNKEYFPYGGTYDKIAYDDVAGEESLINVYYYQWWSVEDYYRAPNPLAGMQNPEMQQYILSLIQGIQKNRAKVSDEYTVEDIFAFDPTADWWIMTPQVHSDVVEVLKDMLVPFDALEGKRRCYYTAILSGKRIFRKFKSPDQNGFTIKFKTADYDEVRKVWFGMVTSLKEPALYYNKGLTEMMFIIASNSKGGVMVEKDAVEDIETFEKQWARTNGVLEVEAGALSGGKIQPKAVSALPNNIDTVIGLSDAALPDVAGFDKGFLGSSENKAETAMLHRQRTKQVISTLATYFDAITLYQKEHARLMITFMRILAENSEGRLIRLIGKDGAMVLEQLSLDGFTDEYDVDISEEMEDATYKEMQSEIMISLGTNLMATGLNIWPVAFKYLPISKQDINELIKIVAPEPDPAAMQMKQQMDALQFEAAKAELANKIADTAYKDSGVAERKAAASKTFSEAQQKNLENEFIVSNPPTNVNLNI